MVVRINKKPESPPLEVETPEVKILKVVEEIPIPAGVVGVNDTISIRIGDYTILDALKELHDKEGVLMLVHRESGDAYRVIGYDQETSLASLEGSNKQRLKPRITERECQFYYPLWRG